MLKYTGYPCILQITAEPVQSQLTQRKGGENKHGSLGVFLMILADAATTPFDKHRSYQIFNVSQTQWSHHTYSQANTAGILSNPKSQLK